MTKLYGSVEAGGTKFVCAVGNADLDIVKWEQFPTTTPEATLQAMVQFFKPYQNELESIAVASFGPIDPIKGSKTYGYITSTPKPGWSHTDVMGVLEDAFDVPMSFTTDVNASAYGEVIARENVENLVYYTIGTGVGGGVIQNGMEIGGIGHPEMGHVYLAKHPDDLDFEGICPFHGDCLEGLASGPTLEARTGIRGEHIPEDHHVWDILAYYIAQAAIQATLNFRPEVIVFGGGVMAQEHMVQRVRDQFKTLLNDYVDVPPLEEYIVNPIVPNNGSATIGNFAVGKKLSQSA